MAPNQEPREGQTRTSNARSKVAKELVTDVLRGTKISGCRVTRSMHSTLASNGSSSRTGKGSGYGVVSYCTAPVTAVLAVSAGPSRDRFTLAEIFCQGCVLVRCLPAGWFHTRHLGVYARWPRPLAWKRGRGGARGPPSNFGRAGPPTT